MPDRAMRDFWDERARENAAYFVDNRLDYDAPDMDRFWRSGEADLAALLEAAGLSLNPGRSVVEIGCGIGRMTRAIARRAGSVVAVDISPEMLERAEAHNRDLTNVRWVLGNGRALTGVADGAASMCLSHVVFQHIPDPDVTLGYIREMGRVLEPGGFAAFVVSMDPGVHRIHWRTRLRRLAGRPRRSEQGHPAWAGSAVTSKSVRTAANDGGLEVQRIVNEGEQFCLVVARKPA